MSFLSGIFTRRGTKVLHEGGPVPTVIPEENVIAFGPLGMAAEMFRGLPRDTYYFYVYDSPASAQAHEASEMKVKGGTYLFFKNQPRFQAGFNAIDEIFKRAPKGIIAVYEVVLGEDDGWQKVAYVNMMSVRPGWKRNGINMAMMRYLVQHHPKRKLEFSDPTHQGEAFIKAAKAAGLPVKS